MGLLNLFKKTNKKNTNTNKEMSPKEYNEYRKNVNSYKEDGTYDFENLKYSEEKQIMDIVRKSKNSKITSLAFYTESTPVIYKTRYILFEIIIQKYKDSNNIFDKLAVGLSYKEKGAYFRPLAIKYINDFILSAKPQDKKRIMTYIEYDTVLLQLGQLYEKEYDFLSAANTYNSINKESWQFTSIPLKLGGILKKIDIDRCIEYYENLLKENKDNRAIKEELLKARELKNKNYVYKPRKNRTISFDSDFDNQVKSCANRFIKYLS